MRIFIVDSDERREYEQAMRQRSMVRTRRLLEKLVDRVRAGRLKSRDKIIQVAERILSKNHGARYYHYTISSEDAFTFSECESFEQEKQIEGKYVIATSEKSMEMLNAIVLYKNLANVEATYRQLKDVLSMRSIYHQVEPRVKAHIFVAMLVLLVQRVLHQRLRESNIDFSPSRAIEALSTIRHVTFRLDGQNPQSAISAGSPDARRVHKALRITSPRHLAPPEGAETAM